MTEQSSQPGRIGSPTRLVATVRRVLSPVWRRIGIVEVLEVPDRRSGAPVRSTIRPLEIDGTTYLISIYGDTAWVRNLRAAGGGSLARRGTVRAFQAVEVDGAERDRVIGAFHAGSPKPVNADFDQLGDAADHPTFRVTTIG
jgi:deazaflavin-dependent oxidoreductase (nitroreductase family)